MEGIGFSPTIRPGPPGDDICLSFGQDSNRNVQVEPILFGILAACVHMSKEVELCEDEWSPLTNAVDAGSLSAEKRSVKSGSLID